MSENYMLSVVRETFLRQRDMDQNLCVTPTNQHSSTFSILVYRFQRPFSLIRKKLRYNTGAAHQGRGEESKQIMRSITRGPITPKIGLTYSKDSPVVCMRV